MLSLRKQMHGVLEWLYLPVHLSPPAPRLYSCLAGSPQSPSAWHLHPLLPESQHPLACHLHLPLPESQLSLALLPDPLPESLFPLCRLLHCSPHPSVTPFLDASTTLSFNIPLFKI